MVKGLFICGTSTAWGPSIEGSVISGMQAAAAVLDRDLDAEIRSGKIYGDPSILTSGGTGWEVFTHGGRKETGLDAVEWAKRMEEYGAGEILLTSMDKDGQKTGFDLELTRSVADALSIPVIASGGVGNLQHLVDGVKQGHASAVLAASIFHFGTHTIAEAKDYFTKSGIPVRERYV